MIFSKIYRTILTWSENKKSSYYLMALSFFESCILPYPPPDILLMPIVLKNPERKYKLALMTTLYSVLGGVFGYFIGYFAYDIMQSFFIEMNYEKALNMVMLWFDKYGVWAVIIAGFSPIPYKLFTISAGFLSMALLPFILASLFSRGMRFFLVSVIVAKFGDSCDVWLKKYIDLIGYGVLLLGVVIYFY